MSHVFTSFFNKLVALFSLLRPPKGQTKDFMVQNLAAKTDSAQPDFHDIYGPLPLPEPPNWPLYLIVLAVVLIFCGLLFYFFKRKKPAPVQHRSAHTTALEELALARHFLEERNSIGYATRASEILRQYIEARFAILSTKQTTTEFLNHLRQEQKETSALLPYRQLLKPCLQQCDLAKYAHKAASMEQMEEMERNFIRFIDETTEEEN